jgi:hypothetical protein
MDWAHARVPWFCYEDGSRDENLLGYRNSFLIRPKDLVNVAVG